MKENGWVNTKIDLCFNLDLFFFLKIILEGLKRLYSQNRNNGYYVDSFAFYPLFHSSLISSKKATISSSIISSRICFISYPAEWPNHLILCYEPTKSTLRGKNRLWNRQNELLNGLSMKYQSLRGYLTLWNVQFVFGEAVLNNSIGMEINLGKTYSNANISYPQKYKLFMAARMQFIITCGQNRFSNSF